jgi:hypothetical protein
VYFSKFSTLFATTALSLNCFSAHAVS